MANKKNNAYLFNHVMCINKAAIEEKGEDAYTFNLYNDYGMISVFDGCGGIGAKKYSNHSNHTAAYIAARAAASAVMNWFETNVACNQNGLYTPSKQITESLKESLDEYFIQTKSALDTEKNELSGSLIRSFPTTASIVLIDSQRSDILKCSFLWAGDSRGFILQPDGLKQCTHDDLRFEEDAFENLYADSPLSNMLNGDGNYHINTQKINCGTPAIIIAATDGVFGYLPSPMHFEWMLLRTMCNSRSFNDWENKLRNEIAAVTGDDSTIIMAFYGWKSFSGMRKAFLDRESALKNQLDRELSVGELRALWRQYKTGYTVCEE